MTPPSANRERQLTLALGALCALLLVPLAGRYGLWDPWETHYGEIARQILVRHDWVSLWWPCSPIDRPEVFHKPVLHFWLLALSMKLFGLRGAGAPAAQMVDSWRVEWALRLPNILLSIASVIGVGELVGRIAGRRAGVLSGIVLATSAQWALVSRQAMTDLPFVAPMTLALVLAGLALLDEDARVGRALERREVALGRLRLSWPRARAFQLLVGLTLLVALPQLLVISSELRVAVRLGDRRLVCAGVVPMLPYFALLAIGLGWSARARTRRELYLLSAWVMCAIATLAKGPAGIGLPAIALVLYLLVAGRAREIWRLALGRGAVLFVACAFPWYHAMLIRHGAAFWNEFIGDNYIRRALGRPGDRGGFDYYLTWIGYGTFPWSGLVAAGGLGALDLDGRPRRRLALFALAWALADFTVVSLVETKFHHYILPALPALAIATGLFLDEVLETPRRAHAIALLLVAAPLTLLCGRDLAALPARLTWLFDYDYVVAPRTGRAWPSPALYGGRYDYGAALWIFTALATGAALWLGIAVLRRIRTAPLPIGEPVAPTARVAASVLVSLGGALALGIAIGPVTHGPAPAIPPHLWVVPALLAGAGLVWLVVLVGTRRAHWAAWAMAALAVASTAFVLDQVLVELSPHWSQKHVIAAYYAARRGPSEPLIAWELYWRGESFYTQDELYRSPDPNERTVFLPEDRAPERLQRYLAGHRGRRVFFLVERLKFRSLRALLPPRLRASLRIVDQSNNKLYLAAGDN